VLSLWFKKSFLSITLAVHPTPFTLAISFSQPFTLAIHPSPYILAVSFSQPFTLAIHPSPYTLAVPFSQPFILTVPGEESFILLLSDFHK
jgi:hypothetical protein